MTHTAAEVERARLRRIARRDALVAAQNGMCPCGEPLGDDVVLDHDHNCCPANRGAQGSRGDCDRGALHRGCNIAIGAVADSPERLRNLANYLQRKDARS